MNTIFALSCAVLLLLTGCRLGDSAPPSRTVQLSFPVPEGQTNMFPSVDDAQIQEALKLIDNVLTSRGFSRDPNEPVPGEKANGMVANYTEHIEYLKTGQRTLGGPCVYIRGSKLDVVVVQGGSVNDPVSTPTRRLCEILQKELSTHFGADRVKIIR